MKPTFISPLCRIQIIEAQSVIAASGQYKSSPVTIEDMTTEDELMFE